MGHDPRSVLSRPSPAPDATVRYGTHPDQLADVRLPSGTGPDRPLVIVIHGGFWRSEYDREHTGPLAADLAALGYPVAQLEYRRTGQPGGGWPGTLDDVAAGIDALPGLVAELRGMDGGAPILLGHSAGGHLALWYAARTAAALGGVLALAPVADLAEAYRLDLDGGAVSALLGGGPQEVPDRYALADPADPALPAPRTRCVMLHGLLDQQVPVEISRRYARAMASRGSATTLIELPEVEHFGLIDPMSPAWPEVTGALLTLR